jgi:hypothetical protein
MLFWAGSLSAFSLLLALVLWRERPPAPANAAAPATEFSAGRAWPLLLYLTDSIGHRTIGSAGADRAVDFLVSRLRELPGVEVVVQDTTDEFSIGSRSVGSHVKNVLVRIPGASRATRDAVLLSAHYDSPPPSVGAADDGVAVASLLEIARALTAAPRLLHPIIININDGEEAGLLGAHAFTSHPWIRDVRAFVNLESAGTAGKAILFQAGPGNAWLTRAYARSVPYPYGSVVGQDIFQSGAIPSDTDFRIYRDFAALRGLDVAMYQGGYAYHTARDRPWNVSPGSMQQMGANALAVARELASGPLPGDVGGPPAIYYDVLGLHMFAYSRDTARVLAALAVLASLAAIALALRKAAVPARVLVEGAIAVALAWVTVILVAMIAGRVIPHLAGHGMGWFARPLLGVLGYAMLALGAMLGVVTGVGLLWRRRGVDGRTAALGFWSGTQLLLMLLLIALTVRSIGSGYLLFWWVTAGALVLALLAVAPSSARIAISALLLLLPLVMLMQVAATLVLMFIPVFGRLPLPVTPDLVLACMVGLVVGLIALPLLAGALRVGRTGTACVVALLIAFCCLTVSARRSPYSPLRPQRLVVQHRRMRGTDSVRIEAEDNNSAEVAVAGISGLRREGTAGADLSFVRPAAALTSPPPTLDLVSQPAEERGSERTVTLRARASGAWALQLIIPTSRLISTSIPRSSSARGDTLRFTFFAPPDSGVRITLRVRGNEPLPVDIAAIRTDSSATVRELLRVLPSWTDATVTSVDRVRGLY